MEIVSHIYTIFIRHSHRFTCSPVLSLSIWLNLFIVHLFSMCSRPPMTWSSFFPHLFVSPFPFPPPPSPVSSSYLLLKLIFSFCKRNKNSLRRDHVANITVITTRPYWGMHSELIKAKMPCTMIFPLFTVSLQFFLLIYLFHSLFFQWAEGNRAQTKVKKWPSTQ